MLKQDLIGIVFGYLKVVKELPTLKKNNRPTRIFLCICNCGNTKTVRCTNLRNGNTKSCGCIQIQKTKDANIKHGGRHTTEYQCWINIKRRCKDKNNASFNSYGGRGIKVCDRWLNSFENFIEDIGRKPTPQHSIDRIDVNGDYEPSNCRWATLETQANNTQNSIKIEYLGNILTLKQWSRELCFNYAKVYCRIVKQKIPFEKAIKYE